MSALSILDESRQILRAKELIDLGARLQVLKGETDLSYERLLKLYKEVAGKSPSKGQLPFSTDWFITWQPNVHSSLFMNIYQHLHSVAPNEASVDLMIKAYKLYQEQTVLLETEPVLSITRAWRLLKFMNSKMLTMTQCTRCKGQFVTETLRHPRHHVCGLCNPPARAGKGQAYKDEAIN